MLTIAAAAAAAVLAAGPAAVPAAQAAAEAADPAAADRDAVRGRLRDWVSAMIRRDAAAMEAVLSPDFQAVTYGGRLLDRAADIAALTTPGDVRLLSVTTRDVEVRLYGDAAVVRGSVTVLERRGEETRAQPIRVTQTWIRQAGAWRLVADQATPIERPGPADAPAAAAAER
jgi:uncharacterized protein (TIGR02246 family)